MSKTIKDSGMIGQIFQELLDFSSIGDLQLEQALKEQEKKKKENEKRKRDNLN